MAATNRPGQLIPAAPSFVPGEQIIRDFILSGAGIQSWDAASPPCELREGLSAVAGSEQLWLTRGMMFAGRERKGASSLHSGSGAELKHPK